MTPRSKNAVRSYETEIEKSREESNWKKAVELAQQLKARSPQHESLAHFLIGEGKLEAFLNEWPPTKENIERAQRELSEARGYLTLATDEAGRKAGVALDSYLLLGKLNYACGAYDDALKNYKLAELNTLTEKELPVRSLKIVAESYAIKGLCLEHTTIPGSTSRYKQAERDADMVRSFELSCDLCVLYLQRSAATRSLAGPLLEAALLRAPLLHLQHGRVQAALHRYREMLSAVEVSATQGLRLTAARQLAELLLRGAIQVYKPPECPVSSPPHLGGTLPRRREDHVSDGPWKPKKYTAINQFVPRCALEEVVLALLVGEAMAARDAVLSQSPEFQAARRHALRLATSLADLLAIATLRWRQTCLVVESLERAMKFSFGERHVWRQRALATVTHNNINNSSEAAPVGKGGGAGERALAVLGHAAQLGPQDAALRLVGAATCYNTNYIEEGIELSSAALSIEQSREGPLWARANLYVAIGYQMKAQKTNARLEKQACNDTTLRLLHKSVEIDDNDYLSLYYLALQYYYLDMPGEAMEWCRSSLEARPSWAGSLRLLCALWGGSGAHLRPRARLAARLARRDHPAAAWPHVAAALCASCPQTALSVGKELLSLVRGVSCEGDPPYAELDSRSDSPHDRHSNRDAASVVAECAGAFRVEVALSEGSSSVATSSPLVAQAWLLLARLCLRLNRIPFAWGCVNEAAALQPYSHLVLYTRGLVHAARREWADARHSFQNALAVHPTHLDTIIQLGSAYYELGWLRLAEKMLREAAALSPARADTWRRLALVLGALREHGAAADCAATAAELGGLAGHGAGALW